MEGHLPTHPLGNIQRTLKLRGSKKGSTTPLAPLGSGPMPRSGGPVARQNQPCPPGRSPVHRQASVGAAKRVCQVGVEPLQGCGVEHGVGCCVLCGDSCLHGASLTSAPDAWLGMGCFAWLDICGINRMVHPGAQIASNK